MATRVAINGFGRIGRLAFRHFMENQDGGVEVVALNDIGALDNLAYLLRHDSIQPNPPDLTIEARDNMLVWGDRKIRFSQVKDPTDLPWQEAEVDLVIEASGQFTRKEDAEKHLEAGAERVIITAPAKGAVMTICMGVNEDAFDPRSHRIISNASCTTNALAPVAKVLDENFGIVQGSLTTIHAYTSSQNIVDGPAKKWRRGRAGAFNIVPTSTGAAQATTQVLPQLEGKMDGMAIRVPVLSGSIIDFVAWTKEEVTVDAVNSAMRDASKGDRMRGILAVTDEELVSADIVGTNESAIIDAPSTMTFGDHMVKVLAWYDNEWAYARRVYDLARYVAREVGR